MARKIKPPDPLPSKAYLVSFGDTMTTLLAFFIVLCSLAEDQTGANLYRGTGSFVKALDGAGLPGPFPSDTSSNAIVRDASSPLYLAENLDSNNEESNPTGPDDDDNGMRVLDRDEEVYQRYLNELERLTKVDKLPEVQGEIVFDIMNRYNLKPPLLSEEYRKAIAKVLPLLRRNTHRVELIVWATMPSPTAWKKASDTASQLSDEIAALSNLNDEHFARFTAVGKTWPFKDARRPYVSIVVRKVSTESK